MRGLTIIYFVTAFNVGLAIMMVLNPMMTAYPNMKLAGNWTFVPMTDTEKALMFNYTGSDLDYIGVNLSGENLSEAYDNESSSTASVKNSNAGELGIPDFVSGMGLLWNLMWATVSSIYTVGSRWFDWRLALVLQVMADVVMAIGFLQLVTGRMLKSAT